ncbi:MAG: kynureninase, partial [Chloroflexota bacterium]
LLETLVSDLPVEIVTPRHPARRGAQLSLRHEHAETVLAALAARGVVADYRAPDLIRVAPMPLYTTDDEVRRFAAILGEVL